jgi:hypothetical protein
MTKKEEFEELDYNDLCTECFKHDECHKDNIDYDQIDKCNEELRKQVEEGKQQKEPEPKEKVEFT